jgi:cell shape-determining protein MreC
MRYRHTVVKTIFILVLLGIFVFLGTRQPLRGAGEGVVRLSQPLLRLSNSANYTVAGFFSSDDEDMVRALREAEFELIIVREENARLERALFFKNAASLPLTGARVLSYFNEFGKEFLLIDQGRDAGVVEGDIVLVSSQIVVGVIVEVGEGFSHVAVASNSDQSFEIDVVPLSIRAIARGVGGRAFALDLLPADAEIRAGDFVALVHTRGNVRATLLLAQVTGADSGQGGAFKKGQAALLARPEMVREVFVVR